MKIKKLAIYFVSFILSISSCGLSAFAENAQVYSADNTEGLQPMTEEEIKLREETSVLSENAYLNDLALERINEQRKEEGMSELEYDTVKLGEETVTENKDIMLFSSTSTQSLIPFLKKVDNSTDTRTANCFPAAGNQGFLGACGAFASTYYQMTYMNALVKGYDVKNDTSKVLSPKFTYTIGKKSDIYRKGGLWPSTAYAIVQKHGCPFNVDFPFVDFDAPPEVEVPFSSNDYLGWPTTAEVWENALKNKVKQSGWGYIGDATDPTPVTNPKDKNLDLIKTYLANGYVLNIVTYEDSWKRKKISVESESGEEQTEEKNICISVNGNEGLHAMTVVGYDDEFYYDINGNGVQEDGEFGAFKLINSRGAEDHYENWFMYDALNAVSSVSPYNQRQQGWAYNEFTWVTMYENYSPKLLTEFDITTNNRGAVDLSLGYGGNLSSEPDEQWKPFIFNETKYNSELGNNSFNLSGTKDEEIASIVLDYTDLINEKEADKIDEELKWYVSSNANISNFKIKEVGFDEEYESTEELPNVAGLISCQCRLPLKVARDKVWKISANYPLNQESIKSSTVYVKDINDNEFYTRAALDGDKNITVTPRTKYKENGYYYLVVEGLKTVGGNGMQIQPIKKHFFVAPDDEEEVDYSIESSFMDNKFLNIIRKLVKKPQGVVYLSDVKDIKELDVSNSDITNLEGIEYFKSLEKLNCSNNKITQLDLSRNINLTTLDVSNNKLTELDLSHNTLLTDVNVNGNDLNPALVGFKINNGYDSSSDDYNDYINDMNEYGSVIDLLEKDSLPKINFVGKKLFAYVKLENSIFVDKLIFKMSTNDENAEIKNESIVLTHVGNGIFTGISSGAYGDMGLSASVYDGNCEIIYTKKHDDLHKEITLGAYEVKMVPGF